MAKCSIGPATPWWDVERLLLAARIIVMRATTHLVYAPLESTEVVTLIFRVALFNRYMRSDVPARLDGSCIFFRDFINFALKTLKKIFYSYTWLSVNRYMRSDVPARLDGSCIFFGDFINIALKTLKTIFYSYTWLSVILSHPKRIQFGYFKFLLFPTSSI